MGRKRAELEAEVERLRAAIRHFVEKGVVSWNWASHLRWVSEKNRLTREVLESELEQLEAALGCPVKEGALYKEVETDELQKENV